MPEEDLEAVAPGAPGFVAGFADDAGRALANWNAMPLADQQRFRGRFIAVRQRVRDRVAAGTPAQQACTLLWSPPITPWFTAAVNPYFDVRALYSEVKFLTQVFLFLLGLLAAVGVYLWEMKQPSKSPALSNQSPSMPRESRAIMEKLDLKVHILTQPVRLSGPCRVEVRLTNQSLDAVLINRRLAVGYRDSIARELFIEVYKRGLTRWSVEKRCFTSVIFHRLQIM